MQIEINADGWVEKISNIAKKISNYLLIFAVVAVAGFMISMYINKQAVSKPEGICTIIVDGDRAKMEITFRDESMKIVDEQSVDGIITIARKANFESVNVIGKNRYMMFSPDDKTKANVSRLQQAFEKPTKNS